MSSYAKQCLVMCAFLISSLPVQAQSELTSVEIKLSRIDRFGESIEAYLKAFVLMIPYAQTSLDLRDSNLTHVKGTVLVRFQESGTPGGLSDKMIHGLSHALERLANQNYDLNGATYSIPGLQILPLNSALPMTNRTPVKRVVHLDATGYRKPLHDHRVKQHCQDNFSMTVDKQ